MSEEDPKSLVAEECDNYIKTANDWIEKIENSNVIESRKGVAERFVRDCKILIEDIDKNETPSSADVVDFQDKFDSMEVRYQNIISNI